MYMYIVMLVKSPHFPQPTPGRGRAPHQWPEPGGEGSFQTISWLILMIPKRVSYFGTAKSGFDLGVSENSVAINPLVLLIIIPIKWL